MAFDMQAWIDRVTNLETVGDSVIALVQGLAQQIRDTQPNAAALEALAVRVDAEATKMKDAVVANTTP